MLGRCRWPETRSCRRSPGTSRRSSRSTSRHRRSVPARTAAGRRRRPERAGWRPAGLVRVQVASPMGYSVAGNYAGSRGPPQVSRLRLRRPLDEHLCGPNARLVEQAHRDRQRELRDHVGRRDHRRDDEREDDEVAAKRLELIDRDHAHADQQHDDDRHLERRAEGDVQAEDRLDVGRDVGRRGDALRREALDELEHPVEHEELHERDAGVGEQAAEHDQRQRRSASRDLYSPGATKAHSW